MKTIKSVKKMVDLCQKLKSDGKSIGLVPTLGFLHEGHEELVKRAKSQSEIVIVSRFVNPTQFRKGAFLAYPRDEKRDLKICKNLGVDYLFSPDEKEMYPAGFDTVVEVKDLVARLEGAKIRWHYKGVTSVVAKLFNITQPTLAYFGAKDPHQLALIKRMTADLNFPVKIISVATKRGKNGVALSSRLTLLHDDGRKALERISKSIKAIASQIKEGATDREKLTRDLQKMISSEPMAVVDFVAIVDAKTLEENVFGKNTLVYMAVYIGDVRVTDNVVARQG